MRDRPDTGTMGWSNRYLPSTTIVPPLYDLPVMRFFAVVRQTQRHGAIGELGAKRDQPGLADVAGAVEGEGPGCAFVVAEDGGDEPVVAGGLKLGPKPLNLASGLVTLLTQQIHVSGNAVAGAVFLVLAERPVEDAFYGGAPVAWGGCHAVITPLSAGTITARSAARVTAALSRRSRCQWQGLQSGT